jgi:threonine/homoserine/homoserine lactone efflux protein
MEVVQKMLPTTSLLAVFLFSFAVGFGAVISPGPISTTIVSQAPSRGWRVGPLVATGHSFMELLMVCLIAIGLGTILAIPAAQTAIALIGGLLLVFMGGMMIFDIWRGRIGLPDIDNRQVSLNSRRLVGLGVLATVSNPFWYAWWVTVAAGYLSQARLLSVSAVAAFYLGHITADFTWDTFLSAVVGGGRRWMNNTVYRMIILVCGAFFIYLGWVFLSHGTAAIL